jgi:hypothetical protein
LADLLPLSPLAQNLVKISRENFRAFLFQEATPSYLPIAELALALFLLGAAMN